MQLYAKLLGASHSEAILFIPGLTGSQASWDENFQALSNTWKLVLIDTLGFGHSPKPDIAYTLDEHLSAIKETLQSLQISRVHLVGHSMGCLLGLAFAQRFPASTGKIILLALPWFQNEQEARVALSKSSPFHRWLAMDTSMAYAVCSVMCAVRPLLLPLMPRLMRDVPPMVAQDALRHTWLSYSRTLQNVIFRAETTNWVQHLAQPILLIHGAQDTTAPMEKVKNNLALLHCAELVELEADHGLIFTHSRVIAEKIAEFLFQTTVVNI